MTCATMVLIAENHLKVAKSVFSSACEMPDKLRDDKFPGLVMNYHFRSIHFNLFKGNDSLKVFDTVGSVSANEKESFAPFFGILHNLFGVLAKISG